MTVISVVASTLLGLAFVIAGGTKLISPELWRRQANDFGAPRWIVGPLPWIELAIGAAVVVRLALPATAVAALAVLAVFTAAIALRLVAGERPACACFGAWSAGPIGWQHLVRNLVLAAAALIVIVAEST